MTKATVDFSEVESRPVIRPGQYEGVVEEIKYAQSETGEFPYLNWKVGIVSGDFEGQSVYMTTSFSPKALWKLQQVFTSFGLIAEKVEIDFDEDSGILNEPDLAGAPCVVTVFNEPYAGRMTSKASDVDGMTEGVAPALAESNGAEEGAPATKAATRPSPFANRQAVGRKFQ